MSYNLSAHKICNSDYISDCRGDPNAFIKLQELIWIDTLELEYVTCNFIGSVLILWRKCASVS